MAWQLDRPDGTRPFYWVTWSICATARLIWSVPALASSPAVINSPHDVRHARHIGDDFFHSRARTFDQPGARVDVGNRSGDQRPEAE
jgi:hypothetical protein